MAAQPEQSASSQHAPFGGCTLLQRQYRTIGQQLVVFEQNAGSYGYGSLGAFQEFREGVAFIPIEVLESYLEDLLDLDVALDRLALEDGKFHFRLTCGLTVLVGLVASLLVGLYYASIGSSLVFSLALSMSLALPFGVLWHYAPRRGAARRMALAQVVSHEINRRRGGDRNMTIRRSPFALGNILRGPQRPLQGAAKNIIPYVDLNN